MYESWLKTLISDGYAFNWCILKLVGVNCILIRGVCWSGVVPIVLQSIAILLKTCNTYCNTLTFCNTYCNTFKVLQYLLQYFWNFAILIAILSKFCNTYCNTSLFCNTFCNTSIFWNTICNTFIFCNTSICSDTHYVTMILRSTYSNILIRSNTC